MASFARTSSRPHDHRATAYPKLALPLGKAHPQVREKQGQDRMRGNVCAARKGCNWAMCAKKARTSPGQHKELPLDSTRNKAQPQSPPAIIRIAQAPVAERPVALPPVI